MKKLTYEEFCKLPFGKVFQIGLLPNEDSPNGLFMNSYKENQGRMLMFVAKKGAVNDWAIYATWFDEHDDVSWITSLGGKVYGRENILAAIDCDEETLRCYRI